ncbi:hypothetical protein K2173_021025 [Erythroxylum novogranatense]|uniref:C2H2-type domain-containing protein n=1 Tax=Erythroxylum novogranatense TaxID=1862640 RepID=A0AAV8TMD9_9ROSI|nr:hypothetical protein K2173_021025 [Erythroxylum novogranatense]
METQEEFMGSNDLSQIVKGKRTKRQRSSSPYKTVTSSSSSGCGDVIGREGVVEELYGSISSATTTSGDDVYESTEEEEDMANCLILLAQGGFPKHGENSSEESGMKLNTRTFSDMITAPTVTKTGFYVYECKTCNRSFPSFQALGGHRASHKKPKATVEEKKTLIVTSMDDHDNFRQFNKSSPDLLSPPLTHTNNVSSNKGSLENCKTKIHECSICGSEFTSGQALGGHMRRHRANTGTLQVAINTDTSNNVQSRVVGEIKPRNILPLDLNLPAPEDDHHHPEPSKFQFSSTKQALVFPAPALVHCHY